MKFIAHRGYSKCFPENSLAAFNAVVRHPENGRSLIGIELDIHLCADGRIPVMHDTVLKDSCGRDMPVSTLSFARMQHLFALKTNGTGPAVPDIAETLECISHATELCFEMKQADYDLERFVRVLTNALDSYGPEGDVVLSSFSAQLLKRAAAATAHLDVRYAFIFRTWEDWDALPDDVRALLHYVHPHYKLLLDSPARLAALTVPAQCWTVNEAEEIAALSSLQASERIRAVMTDDITLSEKPGVG